MTRKERKRKRQMNDWLKFSSSASESRDHFVKKVSAGANVCVSSQRPHQWGDALEFVFFFFSNATVQLWRLHRWGERMHSGAQGWADKRDSDGRKSQFLRVLIGFMWVSTYCDTVTVDCGLLGVSDESWQQESKGEKREERKGWKRWSRHTRACRRKNIGLKT